ncbi:hypothetical protein ScPMuIL_017036 [Solemya velum]
MKVNTCEGTRRISGLHNFEMAEAANGTVVETKQEKEVKKLVEPDTTGDAPTEAEKETKVGDAVSKVAEGGDAEPKVEEEELGEPTELEKKIIKQIEYYFGDMNLPRDRFLQEQVKLEDGWVPMETMVKFNRLKQLSSDQKEICLALKKSDSGLLEVDVDALKVRRCPDVKMPKLTEERKKELLVRTVYAKGFPLESSLDDIIVFFESYGPTENVFMRRDPGRRFKGSCFAVFKEKDAAAVFLKDDKKFQDMELNRESKNDFYKRKNSERKLKSVDDEQKRRDIQEVRIEAEKKRFKESVTLGAILHLTNFSKETEQPDVKNYFQDFGEIAWVDFEKGDQEAWVRFKGANSAVEALEKTKEKYGGKIEINKTEQEVKVLEGDEELEHWKRIFKDQADRRERYKKFGNYGKKRGPPWGKRGSKSKKPRLQGNDSDNEMSGGESGDDTEEKGML